MYVNKSFFSYPEFRYRIILPPPLPTHTYMTNTMPEVLILQTGFKASLLSQIVCSDPIF